MPAILLTRTRATGYVVVPHLRPTVANIVTIGIMQTTPRTLSRCWGRIFPDVVPLRLKQFCNRWPCVWQCEHITTAEGDDVTTIADSRPLRVTQMSVSHISICVHNTHCYRNSVECEIIICFGAVLYLRVFIRESFQYCVQYAVIVKYLPRVDQLIP